MDTYPDANMGTEMKLSAQEEAVRIVCAKHIHQCFWLPRNETHEALRITYSTTSNFTNADLPVILVCGPMFGSRYVGVPMIDIERP